MDWNDVCDLWDSGSPAVVSAPYGDGEICLRPHGAAGFQYKVKGHKTQQDRDWRPCDRWYDIAAANGDFVGMKYKVAKE